ncbi:MAG: M1 family metallopeptidase [Planctomycetota bacterium]
MSPSLYRFTAFLLTILLGLATTTSAQEAAHPKQQRDDAFRQLEEILPTPNETRSASGAPGHRYWQQQVDYNIAVSLDEETRRIDGKEHITYHNHSPDTLRYLWVQLENNRFHANSAGSLTTKAPDLSKGITFENLHWRVQRAAFDGTLDITQVSHQKQPLHHVINGTMMRVDLPEPLATGKTFEFDIAWNYIINDSSVVQSRTGAEYFEDDDNWLFELAHWYPRLAVYDDVHGWQNKQFLGTGEFALEFGNYDVRITVPSDHIVASTGVLQNPEDVLTATQRERLEQAMQEGNDGPTMIVTLEEAEANESSRATDTKTWHFQAERVRDFAWASSRKFLWDCWGVYSGDQETRDGHMVAAMSYWPKEGEPMWSKFSTHAVVHTLEVFSRYTFAYPYPVAISVNGPVGGMEYPMICFNGPRPEADGTYSERTKYGLIGVIIHEVGHNYFPMIVNSDERQWAWMDEGITTFVQHLAEVEWDDHYQGWWGEPSQIVGYMLSEEQVPIMTQSDSILSYGNNAYGKPMTALNILRETIMGRELFDFAFAEYARRWKFKRPQPSDFFRTMEDASAVDLDWFWHGWFYTTDHVDLALADVQWYQLSTLDPEVENALKQEARDAEPETLQHERNAPIPKRFDVFPELKDFYDSYDPLATTPQQQKDYLRLHASLNDWEREQLEADWQFYILEVENRGGLVMPILLRLDYEDGSSEERRIPAEVWRKNNERVKTMVTTDRPLKGIILDPRLETADAVLDNNFWPPRAPKPTRFDLFKKRQNEKSNPMREAQEQGK